MPFTGVLCRCGNSPATSASHGALPERQLGLCSNLPLHQLLSACVVERGQIYPELGLELVWCWLPCREPLPLYMFDVMHSVIFQLCSPNSDFAPDLEDLSVSVCLSHHTVLLLSSQECLGAALLWPGNTSHWAFPFAGYPCTLAFSRTELKGRKYCN